MSPLLGRTRLCFLPIDVRCLHITQTVRLWTRQKEKVRLELKNDTMTIPSVNWSLLLSPNAAVNENIFIRSMHFSCPIRHLSGQSAQYLFLYMSHRDDLVFVDPQQISHNDILPLHRAETETRHGQLNSSHTVTFVSLVLANTEQIATA